MFELPESAFCFADSARGIYIPQHFAESVKRDCVTGVTQEQWDILESGPETDFYWDVWCEIEQNARVTSPDTGIEYVLYQDGDLWLVPSDFEFEES